ncbi:sensor histidine kinase [Fangia hongkongensis]|uniref:sensor histidine kinase n=1 Tax=Fangia hongkongensis TaxID=270495 RepID=UPI00037CB56D|nr:ATP-binding protein [Fangia hongkongensis]MBK2124532.1 two-component sensor histidine kinase [Fangia hongkongensis]
MTQGKNKLQSAFIFLGIIALVYSLVAIIAWLSHSIFFTIALGLEHFHFDIAILGVVLSLLMIFSRHYKNITALLGALLVLFSVALFLQEHYFHFLFDNVFELSTTHETMLSISAKIACLFMGLFFILKRAFKHTLFNIIQLILLYSVFIVSLLAIIGVIFDVNRLYQFNNGIFFLPLAIILLLLSLQNLSYFISKKAVFSLQSAHIPALITSILLVLLGLTWQIIYINQQQLHYKTMQKNAYYAANEMNILLGSDIKATKRFFVRLKLLTNSPGILEKDIEQYFTDYKNLQLISTPNITNSTLSNYINPQQKITQQSLNKPIANCLDALQLKRGSSDTKIAFSGALLCIQDTHTQALAIFNTKPMMQNIFEGNLFSSYYASITSLQNTIYKSPRLIAFKDQLNYTQSAVLLDQPFEVTLFDKAPSIHFGLFLSLLYFSIGMLIIILILVTILSWQHSLKQNKHLRKLNQSLEQSNKELDDFAYIASHDLKEPLRGIANFSSFLLEDYEDKLDNEGKMQLKTLSKLAKRMEALINDLLSFSRVGRVDFAMQLYDLNQILNDKLVLLQPFLEENQAKVIIKKPLPILNCDKVRIGEVFQNFITNGIKYNDNDQKIITIDYTETSNSYTFSVEDNGIGIKKEDFKRIFSIFKRLHAKDAYGGGTGAGMTISDKIIKRHGGEIWLTSKPGKGSIFYFSIAKTFDTVDNKES